MANSGRTWRRLPPVFGASWHTVHRRFTDRSTARVRPNCTAASLSDLV
ncbi:hypothetical protein GT352_04025 [Streptomyces sp. SID1046]|nr:hypothetical protein [Streptomyces sp. SID1046]